MFIIIEYNREFHNRIDQEYNLRDIKRKRQI